EFVCARFSEPAAGRSMADAVSRQSTQIEYDRLRARGGRPRYAVARWGLKTVGRLSDGIRLGWRTGFDSGLTLDYVYENQAGGIALLGRLIDRGYLSSLGWRGIRQRRMHLGKTLRDAMGRLSAEGREVHLLDVASGPGRYVLETIRSTPQP